MSGNSSEIQILQSRVSDLERENAYLKRLLEQAGIPYELNTTAVTDNPGGSVNTAQSGKMPSIEITYDLARRYFSYFWGRMDVYSKRSQNRKTGKSGYYPQCEYFWRRGICPKTVGDAIPCKKCHHRKWKKLSPEQIIAHLEGKRVDASDVIGVYPLFPDGTCRFLVFDFDCHTKEASTRDFANLDDAWIEEVNAMRQICAVNQIPALVERSRSGKGAHLWIFFDHPMDASLVRRFGFALLDRGAESVNLKSFQYYDRMLPAQDSLSDEQSLGNLIALPLQGQALKEGNSAFIDENWIPYPNQWEVLFATKRLSQVDLEHCMEEWNIQSDVQNLIPDGETKPWEYTNRFHKEDVTGVMHITLANRVYVETSNIRPRLQNQIRRMASISNPRYFKNAAMGLSNYASPRYIYLGEDEGEYLAIPRGLLENLKDRCDQKEIPYQITDQRTTGREISVTFTGELRQNQEAALQELLKYDCGILSAATAFGKTVVCTSIIARKKVSTLILLESSALIEQWERSLSEFLTVEEALPEYQTKSGRTRRRKSHIGLIHGAKDTSNGIIDIAMVGSLRRKGDYHFRLQEYGLILVDECHHSASETVKAILMEVKAKYVYGVTATPFRADGLEKVNEMLLGSVRYRYTAKQRAEEQGIRHFVIPRFTRAVSPHGRKKLHISDAYQIIRYHAVRNAQIVEDVKRCVADGRTPVVLSRFTDHAATLYEELEGCADHLFLLLGTKSKKVQREQRKQMEEVKPEETMILIATGQLVGEGFDFPRLDTLVMATPVAWKGIVEQYAGRLNRDYEEKESVMILDYVDAHIPVFDRMYAKRLKAYRQIGYELYTGQMEIQQSTNAIFDIDTYLAIYERDLQTAAKEIVISSPTLGRDKVVRMLHILKERQEVGVKVTIVTWHPNTYENGKDKNRTVLMELLHNAGFHIEWVEEHCECYAVIDDEIVWYGSVNLLSKEDVNDNIMRVASREIAAELLEMTFQKENTLKEYE